ncbi:DnaA regulatory inactivator Hda [Neptunicella sp. SCSIO 80796]|uniref:DnaA regulatory inactivator Hda n=1 Tax=Neptunicella plasticusilytica TaxID=3117012 RepID=UPI003A4E5A08
MNTQLSLPVHLPDDETFSNFVVGNNQVLLAQLMALFTQPQNSPLITYLSGEHGVGKSHLLYSVCAQAGEQGKWVSYLDLAQIDLWSTEVLTGLEQCDYVCLDNVHALKGHRQWQVALFDLINRVIENQHARLVISGDAGPAQMELELADLQSRLAWGVSFVVQRLSDEDCVSMLIKRAGIRGINLPEEVGLYLLSRSKRDTKSLMNALNQLDQLSLQQQRKLTIPFVKQALSF